MIAVNLPRGLDARVSFVDSPFLWHASEPGVKGLTVPPSFNEPGRALLEDLCGVKERPERYAGCGSGHAHTFYRKRANR
jgi:hypothetical protein